ncbi:nucleotide pyrophosphohydrolase [Duganella sp. FT50W]|uniref:Nucleotide pyrophosphohydrolase n=1 Tax=Duganella lactea TaxID=2692173 RepID=A0A6L8MPG3_9BURK|nr:nucleotide pyrophosphohydrolase [Duganella lactea]MYM84132.1 nucleotide pyrophosphohydrolase [Duganella lactea]
MESRSPDLETLRTMLRTFVVEREWGQFHTPKNLATALSVEAAELLEPFQWLATGDGDELTDGARAAVRLEMADVLAYLLLLADRMNVDLCAALAEKIAINAGKYPADEARGSSKKYTAYEGK